MNALSKFGQRLSKARACIHRCLRSKRIVLSSLAALAATLLILPQPAAAIFGFGDIVFDPTSYATLGKILVSDASTLTKITAEIAQLKAIYSNGMQMYNQALAMAQTVNGLRRLNWLTVGIHFVKDQTQNQFGETVNWAALLNGNPALALSAWKSATLPVSTDASTFLSGQTLGSSAHLATLASIEATDGSAAKCLAVVAEYRGAAQQNSNAIQQLQIADDDDSSASNSVVEQLNLVNGAQAATLHQQDNQGALHACQVEQQIIANSWQRDAAAEAMNIYGTATVAQQTTNTNYGGIQDTYYKYIPQ